MTDQIEDGAIVALTTEIAAAYVSNNMIPSKDLRGLLSTIHGALADLANPGDPEPEKPEPLVSIRASVRPDHLVCMACGRKLKMLKRHLSSEHNMTPQGYKDHFGLKADYPITAPAYAAERSKLAKQIGLGTKQKRKRKS